jgi:penicillin-binding protein 1A
MHITESRQRAGVVRRRRPRSTGSQGGRSSRPRRRPRSVFERLFASVRAQRGLTIAKWSAVVVVAGTAFVALVVALMFWRYGSDSNLPQIGSLADYHPKQVIRVVTDKGDVIGEIFDERRTYVPIEQIPPVVIQAFLAAEDAGFFEHSGIDYVGMLRAVLVNLRSGEKRQGASTITQQVVKTFLLSPERTFRRKFQEIILARRLENALKKDEILALYLNQIYFGHGRYGVEEAARFYFGKSISEVNAGEAALLAALPKAPERYSPAKPENAERAKERQRYVLSQMVRQGYLDAGEAQRFVDAPIAILGEPFPNLGSAPEWVDVARRALIERYGEATLATLGGQVEVTVDLDMQAKALAALRQGLHEVDARQGFGRPFGRVKPDQIRGRLTKLGRQLPKAGPKPGARYPAIVTEVYDAEGDAPGEIVVDLGGYEAAVVLDDAGPCRTNPDGKPASQRFTRGDLLHVRIAAGERAARRAERTVTFAPGPEGAVVVLDPRTRRVLALVGGYETRVADFNRATMAKRQAGSTFKPFVFAAAVDSGEYTAASIVNDAPEVYDLWKPENYEKGAFLGPVRIREALARSINTVAIRVMNDVGPQRVADLARAMGIRAELPAELSLALGSGEVTPLELTNAFATFAAKGIAAEPQLVTRVEDFAVPAPVPSEVLNPGVAYAVTDMMRSVVTEGTGRGAAGLGITVAGKTGTTNDSRDAWFIGMTPTLVVGVWVGFDEPTRIGRKEGGSRTALPIFTAFMTAMRSTLRDQPFERPPGVVEVRVDRRTGLLAPAGASDEDSYLEVFLDGSAPTESAPTSQEVDIDSFVLEQYEDGGELVDELAADDDSDEAAAAAPAP